MSGTRACKSGLAAESQKKIESNYDEAEASKCLYWIKQVGKLDEIPSSVQNTGTSHEDFYKLLGDGLVLCKLIDVLMPKKVNWQDKTFQPAKIEAMKVMRERERIALFTNLILEYGVPDSATFPTESLHERGALNLAQVCVCIRALGMQAQSKPGYSGPDSYWPKKSEKTGKTHPTIT